MSKSKLTPYAENISEATAACLVTMVQGNILLLGLSHWIIASQTGIISGVVATSALLITKTRKRWLVSTVLGVTTAVVDYFVHPGMFGSVIIEAIITGVGAAVLSYVVSYAVSLARKRKHKV